MTPAPFTLRELAGLDDPLLLPWLDLYETAFPPEERVLVSRILRILQNPAGAPAAHLRVALDAKEALLGLAYTYEPPELGAAFLWYLAVVPQSRGQGAGAWLYQAVLGSLPANTRAMIFDVEDPQRMPDEDRRSLAARRIGFYQRQGACLMGGIRYVQRIGTHLPPLLLRLMVHPLDPALLPGEAFSLALAVFGDEVLSKDGEPGWA
jgi:GNAT superfamily N-acetyltransferase